MFPYIYWFGSSQCFKIGDHNENKFWAGLKGMHLNGFKANLVNTAQIDDDVYITEDCNKCTEYCVKRRSYSVTMPLYDCSVVKIERFSGDIDYLMLDDVTFDLEYEVKLYYSPWKV